jgi:phosphoribosylamine--glycine ligase
MKVLVVGQGGREHALCWKLKQSPKVKQVYCAPGNAGTALEARNIDISATDIPGIIQFCKKEGINFVIPGPEAPLVMGIVDALQKAGIKTFGPTQAAARLEGSKTFSKQIMRLANVPTAESASFDNLEDANHYLDSRLDKPIVVKADGLAAGKGVTVCKNIAEAKEVANSMLTDGIFKEAGKKIVIEECLTGNELSVLAIIDGKTIIILEPAQDHKAAYDGDQGPNTGGMGAYSPSPLAKDELLEKVLTEVFIPMVHTMRKEGCPFQGILYAGLMLTPQGIKVLEFNVRMGDPETQPIMMRLKTDLAELLLAAAEGKLNQAKPLEWDPRPAVCVVMAAEGYPGNIRKGDVIKGIAEAEKIPETKVFQAGTLLSQGLTLTDGGRVLGVTALGETLSEAKLRAYQAVKQIRWQGAWCRKDISDKARLS